MKPFDRWFAEQGTKAGESDPEDEVLCFHCAGCGKFEFVLTSDYEAGNTDWYFLISPAAAVCGGSERCMP